jgi:hypothetical protein
MALNTDETKSILVSGKRLRSRLDNSTLDLQLNGTTIGQVTSKKLLGVRPTLDEELSFREHVEKLCKKLSKKIGLLKKIRLYLPLQERKLYYNAIVKPTIMYGSLVWTSCSTGDLKRFFRLQKRAARVILQVDTRSRTVDNFKNVRMPSYIDKLFITNQSIHSRQTRHGGYNLVCPRYTRSSEVGRSFTISSIKLWNSLPPEIKRKQSIGSFKNALRKHFIGTYANIDSFSVNM